MIALNVILNKAKQLDSFSIIVSFLTAFIITFYIIPLVIKIAHQYHILDIPNGELKQHKKPVAYLGGLGIYAGILITLCLWYPLHSPVLLLFFGSTLLLLLGFLDDLMILSAHYKFLGQIVAGICFLRSGLYLKTEFFESTWTIPFSLLWILTIINAFNLIDVLDGLTATTAISAASSFLIFALITQSYTIAQLLVIFIGALLAFLYYNWPPASIYLGDMGSLFIGGFLSVIPFLLGWSTYNPYGYFIPIIILAIPLCEIGSLILIRTAKRIPFYRGSPDHFCHYLQRKGWSKVNVLQFVVSLSFIQCLVSLLFYFNYLSLIHIIFMSMTYLFYWFYQYKSR